MSNEEKQKNEKENLSQSKNELDNITLVEEKNEDVQKVDSSHLLIKNARYEIAEEYREALDLEMLEERYSDIFEKYDYIVGDISRDQLRLRGFYEDNNDRVPVDMKISTLEDYLAEYCNFGCQYFVLKRLDPKKNFKPYKKDKKSNNKKKSFNKKGSKRNNKNSTKQSNKNKKGRGKAKKNQEKKGGADKGSNHQSKFSKQSFVKKERGGNSGKKPDKSDSKEVRSVTDKKGKEKFQIRKNKQE